MSSTNEHADLRKLRRANDAAAAGTIEAPTALFDEFWRSGELAILFGASGSGKSLLAIQIAEALARGRPPEDLGAPRDRHKVLYVDLVLSNEQFAIRYSRETRGGRRRAYKFSSRLYRDRPDGGEALTDWVRSCVVAEGITVVVIDDLSVITQCEDGTRETFELIRSLRHMTREMGVSVLVLADSHPSVFQRDISERDLRRSRMLCAYADSVFAIEAVAGTDRRNVVQTRSQAGGLVWTKRSPARFTLAERSDGFVGLELYHPELTSAERETIITIKNLHASGSTFRQIADDLEMSKSTVARLHSKWTPCMSESRPVRTSALCKFEAADTRDAFDPTQRHGYFPGCEEYDEASEDPKFDMEYIDEDDEGYDAREQSLLAREGYLIELARADAHKAYEKTGVAPRLNEHPKYREFVECVAAGGDPFLSESHALACVLSEPPALAGGQFSETDTPNGHAHSQANGPPAYAAHTNLTPDTDAYGREILVESRESHTGKPLIWYQTDKHGTTRRYHRRAYTILSERLPDRPAP